MYIDGSVQDSSNSSALAMELLQSCTNPSICNSLRQLNIKVLKFKPSCTLLQNFMDFNNNDGNTDLAQHQFR